MATRTISTKLAIEGESEYRAAMTRVNGELKTLKSELALVKSEYQTNANSMSALTAKGEALSKIYAEQKNKVDTAREALVNAQKAAQQHRDEVERLNQKIKENNERLEELKKTEGDTSEETERLTKENEELGQALKTEEASVDAAEKGVRDWQQTVNRAQIELNNLGAELKENERYLDEARNSTDGCAKSIDEFGKKTEKSASAMDALAAVLVAGGLKRGLQEIKELLEGCVKSSMEFESAMAGVAKTTDLSDEELAAMGETFKELSTKIPITATELAGIGEAAGQLGIQKENIAQFAEVMANLGVATNLTSEEAATLLARFANVTGMDASNFENLGSVVVALGNNFATTESEIVNLGQRISAAGTLAGLTEPEIMALAAAMSSVGIGAEAGGTAMTQTLTEIEKAVTKGGKEVQAFAEIAGMSADEFSTKWRTSPIEAIEAFISGLGGLADKGESATQALDELGLTGIRQANMLKSMSLASDVLKGSIDTANAAWKENTALAKEAATRYETTESKFQMFSNAVDNVKVAIGDQLNPALAKLAETGTDVLNWAADFIEQNEWLAPVIGSVAIALTVLTVGVAGWVIASNLATKATLAFNAALESNPFGLLAVAIASAIAALISYAGYLAANAEKTEALTIQAERMNDVLAESKSVYEEATTKAIATADAAQRYIDRLKELEATGLKTNEQQKEYHNTLVLLTQTVPELAQYIDLENDKIIGGTQALEAHTQALKENAIQQAYQEYLTEIYKQHAQVMIEQAENSVRATEAQQRYSDAQKAQAEILAKMKPMEEAAERERQKYADSTGALVEASDYLSDEYYELEKQASDLGAEMAHQQSVIEDCTKAQEEDTAAVEEAEEAIRLAEDAYKELTGAADENTEATDDNAEAQESSAQKIAGIQEKLAGLKTKYEEARDSARESIENQIGLFDTFEKKVSADTDTVEEMVGRWKTQAENIAQYTENIRKAAVYGIDEGLIQSLSDGSTESAGYVSTIVSELDKIAETEGPEAAAKKVREINEAFGGTGEAMNSFGEIVGAASTGLMNAISELQSQANEADFSGFTQAVEDAFGNLPEKFEGIGSEAASNAASSLTDNAGVVTDAADSVGGQAGEHLATSMGEGGAEAGKKLTGDAAGAVEEHSGEVTDAVDTMGKGVTETTEKNLDETADSFDKKIKDIADNAERQMRELKRRVNAAIASLPKDFETTGQDMINGMIRGLNNRSGALYSKIGSIVNTAISSAKTAAATASPSKKTTRIFEDVGEGMIVGLEHKRRRIEETAQSVVDDALRLNINTDFSDVLDRIDTRMPVIEFPESRAASSIERKVERLSDALIEIGDTVAQLRDSDRAVVLEDGTIVGRWAPLMDKELGKIRTRKERAG